jgi:putative flippase GtrA
MRPQIRHLRTLLSFVSVGGSSATAYIIASTILTHLGVSPWLASVGCYAALIPAAYFGQRWFTFQATTPHASSFPRYVIVQLIGLALAAILPRAFADTVKENPLTIFIAIALLIAATNFVLLRWWAFQMGPETSR